MTRDLSAELKELTERFYAQAFHKAENEMNNNNQINLIATVIFNSFLHLITNLKRIKYIYVEYCLGEQCEI